MKTPPRIYVVDDDPRILKALGALLQASHFVVRTFESPRLFLERYDPGLPGCILCDYAMPECDGLTVQRTLKARGSRNPIIFLSGQATVTGSVEAMRQGAEHFLTKPVLPAELLQAVRLALQWDSERRAIEARVAQFTRREREVVVRIAAGMITKQIAAEFNVSDRTIKFHRENAIRKADARSTTDLVRLVVQAGLLEAESPNAAGSQSVDGSKSDGRLP